MAENKNSRKSEGLCEKIHNAVNPFRSRIRRISHHQPQGKMVPVEFNHFSAQNTKKLVALSPVVQSAGKENNSVNNVQEFDDREILIVRGRKFTKYASRKTEVAAAPEKVEQATPTEGKPRPNHARFAKAKSNKDDDWVHEGKFTDYINKVKNRMMKTTSNVGGGGGVEKTLSLK